MVMIHNTVMIDIDDIDDLQYSDSEMTILAMAKVMQWY